METRFIKGSDCLYEVTDTGIVLSHYDIFPERVKVHISGKGEFVYLTMEGKDKRYYIDHLVATHFIENPEGCRKVGHRDNDIYNNRVSNLFWYDNSPKNEREMSEEERKRKYNDYQREYHRKYRELHREENRKYHREYSKEYREEHKEEYRKYQREYSREYRRNHMDQINDYHREYYRKNHKKSSES